MNSMGGKSFGKPIRVSPMPKAPDGKSLPAGLPAKDIALSKRHRLDSIKFHKEHAKDHTDRIAEHRAALKDPSYAGVRGARKSAALSGERNSLVHLIAVRQSLRDGSKNAPLREPFSRMTK